MKEMQTKCESCQCYTCFDNWRFNLDNGTCSSCDDCDNCDNYQTGCSSYDNENDH